MTISRIERTEDEKLALSLMLDNLPADRPFEWEMFDADLEPFKAILPTTWRALSRRGLVFGRSFNRYELSAAGWIAALKVTGRFGTLEMTEQAGRLSAALKAHVKGRHANGCTTLQEVAAESGLDEAFVRNAINSHLIQELFGTIDAYWAPDDQMKNYIEIPLDFGH